MATQTSVLKYYDSGVLDYTPILTATTTTTSSPASAASTIESNSIIEKPMKSILDKKMKKKKKKKRGTRTTGVGASTSTLSSANSFDSDANEEENDEDDIINNNNPMLGKLWVQTPTKTTSSSSSSSLIFKLYPSSKDTRVGEAIYIEVSEPPTTKNTKGGRKRRRRELHVQYITNNESMKDNDSKSHPQSSSSSSSSSVPSSIASKFLQIEGIYGVYHLPHSGPHIVLITESERVYKSPSIILLPSSSDDVPLMELRKITCLEIVSLREGGTDRRIVRDNDNGGEEGKSTKTPSKTTMMMEEEEARQLRLLRKSFAEHDLYFTVPCHYYRHHYNIRRRHERRLQNVGHSTNNCELGESCNDDNDDDTLDDDEDITVPDVTRTLQRSFMALNSGRQHSSATISRWWTQYFTATDDATDTATATATNKKKREEDKDELNDERSDDSVWGIQQQSNRRAGPQMAPQRGIDPRFFWNELPAFSLMPPPSSRHLRLTSDDSREKSSSSSSSSTTTTTSSPYCHLLDHLIPVTSAFVGVRQNIPIPLASSTVASSSSKSISSNNNDKQQQQQQDMYDQLLISRRSKYRAGTRFTRRGTDETGNVANYAETEQICFVVSRSISDLPIVNENGGSNGDNNKEIIRLDTSPTTKEQNTPSTITTTLREIYSHVQTRGSIPLHWSSPVMTVGTYRPRVYICVDPLMQARGLRDHLLGDLQRYSLSSSSFWASSPSSFTGVGGDDALGSKTKITMVNLIDRHGDQGRLGRAFDSVLSAVLDVYKNDDEADDDRSSQSSVNDVENCEDDDDDDGSGSDDVTEDDELKTKLPQHSTLPLRVGLTPNSIKHIWYDFHAECKGGRYDRLSQLLEQVIPTLNDQGYFCAALSSPKPIANTTTTKTSPTWEIRSLQDGVVRTNCMDCLDRTNVVQSMFGRYILYRQLQQRIGLSASSNRRSHRRTLPLECVVGYKQRPLTLPWTEGEAAHRYLWADNADAISRLYAGTPALKGDFTRTGKRTRRGAFDDGLNSLQRYYLNNFIDADRQEGMDLLVGSVDFDVTIPISSTMSGNDDEYSDVAGRVTDESSRLLMLQDLEKRSSKRRGFDGTHARIKVKTGETFGVGDGTNSGTGGAATQNQSLKWMPKDLHYYMKHEAQLSRSPLSIASREENLDAPTSSDFLLQVTSSAAGDEVPLSDSSGDVMNTERSLLITGDRPWWAISSFKRDGDAITKCNRALANVTNGKSMQNLGKKIIGLAPQPVVIFLSLLLLCRTVPILFAALILAIVSTSGSSTLVQHEDHAGD